MSRYIVLKIIDYIDFLILLLDQCRNRDVINFFLGILDGPLTPKDFEDYQNEVKALHAPEKLTDYLNELELILIEEKKWEEAS